MLNPGIYTHVTDQLLIRKSAWKKPVITSAKFIFNMHIDLDQEIPQPELPPGIKIRTAQTGEDDHIIHALVQKLLTGAKEQPSPSKTGKDS